MAVTEIQLDQTAESRQEQHAHEHEHEGQLHHQVYLLARP